MIIITKLSSQTCSYVQLGDDIATRGIKNNESSFKCLKNKNISRGTMYWIERIIRRIKVSVGGQLIQEFTGQYLLNMVNRDFTVDKKILKWREVT